MSELRPLLPFFCLLLLKTAVQAVVCPGPSATGRQENLTCPAFKTSKDSIFCCVSKLPSTSHSHPRERVQTYFCCTEADYQKEQQEIADAEFRTFIKNYLVLIILGFLASSCFAVLLTSIICRRVKRCPLYAHPNLTPGGIHQTTGVYRPVDTIPPKMYEAPPPYRPYENFVPPPGLQGNNEWNCVLENEVNVGRHPAPTV